MNRNILQRSHTSSIQSTLRLILPGYKLKELILQNLLKVWKRFPNEFDETLFKKAELLFALTSDDFKAQRLQEYLVRLICTFFSIQKNLRKLVTLFGEKRHLQFRIMPTTLKFPFGSKSVLGVVVGICLFDKQETFEEKHLLLAVQKILPHLQTVWGSVVLHHHPEDNIRLVSVEFEKKGGGPFSCEEIALLKRKLQPELQACIEKNTPSLFMISNEEEVMKNILLLSRELDFSHAIPEIIINFEQQVPAALSFIVILVRIVKEKDPSIEELLHQFPSGIKFSLDRNQIIGYLNDTYPKEATVFHLEIPLEKSFIRSDFSINLYLARQKIKSFLLQAIGPIRDFNGGMIFKQGELLIELKNAFPEASQKNPLLIENFFYSLSPIEKQVTLPFSALCRLFELFLETVDLETTNEQPCILKRCEEKQNHFAILKSDDFFLFKTIENLLTRLYFKESLITFKLNLKSCLVMGFIHSQENIKSEGFNLSLKLHEGIEKWRNEHQNKQIARLAIQLAPTSFDPRVGGDEGTRVLLKLLFEGLMRTGSDGKPAYALAHSVNLSSNEKTYLFYLRPSYWSDGTPLIAYDFEYAWKKILSPEFDTPFASIFYPIKNARLIKERKVSIDEMGVKAIDAHTLQVVLEHPITYFLELVSLPLFSPIPHKVDQIHPNWTFQEGESYICNGPFCLKKKRHNYGYEFEKNRYYWDEKNVSLKQVTLHKVKEASASELFEQKKIDWIGNGFPYWDPSFKELYPDKITAYPSPKIFWCVFNTQMPPFDNKKIRQALSYCINKSELLAFLNNKDAIPAHSPLPARHSLFSFTETRYSDSAIRALFNEGLKEIGLKKEDFPSITLHFPPLPPHFKIAQFSKRQWENIIDVSCKLESQEWPYLFPKICGGECQISLLVWTSTVNDPTYTLNAFKYRDDEINFSKWEHIDFQRLLDLAIQDKNGARRLSLFKAAEKLLIDEVPVIPLYYEKTFALSRENFHVDLDPFLGYPDFKNAKWSHYEKY